jgi:uncharacterized MAPEG superfamily protein
MTTNFSIFAVPVYWLLCIIPHTYAVSLIVKNSNGRYDNSSPRSTNYEATLRKTVPGPVYARYERAEAAQKNGFENFALFVGAVMAGNMAHLEARTLNIFVAAHLISRIGYTIAYINISTHRLSPIRSCWYFLGLLQCLWVYVAAGLVLS